MTGEVLDRNRSLWPAIFAVFVIAIVYWGWRELWFLTDDAFIAFRYVSNSMLGYGLVWNPAPFRPVEGYTSFAWVMLLKYVWLLTGIAPPQASNWIALGFGYATLFLSYRWLKRIAVRSRVANLWPGLVLLGLVGIATNRTFLTWLSSGLETAMFNFALVWWAFAAIVQSNERSRCWTLSLCASSSLLVLTRPDGLLYFVAGLALLAVARWSDRPKLSRADVLGYLVLLLVPAHVAFRRMYYGEWLPNTYYAKVAGVWPQRGLEYALSFVIEYGVWVWILLALVVSVKSFNGRMPDNRYAFMKNVAPIVIAMGAIAGHVGYYIVIVGGDHFEYRVLSHTVPLLFVSAAWMAQRAASKRVTAYVWMAAFVVASWPIPWAHWYLTHDPDPHIESIGSLREHRALAPFAPVPFKWPVAKWDRMQASLTVEQACVRHHIHKAFWLQQQKNWPSRERGSRFNWENDRAIAAVGSVGVPAWILPEVAIIDQLGLNDWVIARNPYMIGEGRYMAHSRRPPPGYVECFEPNVVVVLRRRPRNTVLADRWLERLYLNESQPPISDDQIRRCEARKWY